MAKFNRGKKVNENYTSKRRQKRASERLSGEANLFCQRLCIAFVKDIENNGITYEDQAAIDLMNAYENKWHAWLRPRVKNPSLATKKLFTTMLQYIVDRNNNLKPKK